MTDDSSDDESSRVDPPDADIVCVDCGGTAHLITPPREDNLWYAGDIATYRCSECRDRWDLVLE